jgi:uncharacterized protein YdiU (UPF0061 family)
MPPRVPPPSWVEPLSQQLSHACADLDTDEGHIFRDDVVRAYPQFKDSYEKLCPQRTDLTSMAAKARSHGYAKTASGAYVALPDIAINAFIADCKLMHDNCIKFNGATSVFAAVAKLFLARAVATAKSLQAQFAVGQSTPVLASKPTSQETDMSVEELPARTSTRSQAAAVAAPAVPATAPPTRRTLPAAVLAGSHSAVAVATSGRKTPTAPPLLAHPQKAADPATTRTHPLSIMGQEYYQQDPFKTGNGYGDGRAISVLEVACPQPQQPPQSWEFQLKGSGQTPYCRGADGRAVLRSSIREFLGAEAMHRLGVATARALCLIVSGKEMVRRPWYSKGSTSEEPDVMMAEPAAITTRVAPSLLRVGQLELFGRRARKKEHPDAMMELAQIVAHAAQREYAAELGPVPPWQRRDTSQDNAAETPNSTTAIDPEFQRHVLRVAAAFRGRLIALVGHWIRVGFCQGNFNSDNCSVAGRTLDYGPFGFMELFNHSYQSWTGGGDHYSFLGQLGAAGANFKMFCVALTPLFEATDAAPLLKELNGLVSGFNAAANDELMRTFASKLGLARLDATQLTALMTLLSEHPLDYTIFFRTLGSRPTTAAAFRHAIYPIGHCATCAGGTGKAETAIAAWLQTWHKALEEQGQITAEGDNREWAARMDVTNPKYVPREWMLAAAYRAAIDSQDYSLVHELQAVFDDPYAQHVGEDNTDEKLWESKYFRRASVEDLSRGGVAVMSCSS